MSQVALNFRCSEQKFTLFCNSFGNFFNGMQLHFSLTKEIFLLITE